MKYSKAGWIVVLLLTISCGERELTLCDCLERSKNMDDKTKEQCMEITKKMKGDNVKMMKELQKCEKEE